MHLTASLKLAICALTMGHFDVLTNSPKYDYLASMSALRHTYHQFRRSSLKEGLSSLRLQIVFHAATINVRCGGHRQPLACSTPKILRRRWVELHLTCAMQPPHRVEKARVVLFQDNPILIATDFSPLLCTTFSRRTAHGVRPGKSN